MYKDLIDILRNNQLACPFAKNETAAYLLKSNGNRNKYPPITKKVTTLHTTDVLFFLLFTVFMLG